MATCPVSPDGDVPVKWVAGISLALIWILIAIPLYDNVQQQRVMTALLRERNTNGFALRRLSFLNDSKATATHPWIMGLEGYKTHSWFLYHDEMTASRTTTENQEQDKKAPDTSPQPQHHDSLLPPPILATDISPYEHLRFLQATNEQGVKLSTLSSVDYDGCCGGGVGHLLANMANAAWIASRLEFALHTWWGHCGNDTEVFQHLFGPQHKEHLQNVTSTNKYVRIHDQIPGTDNLQRRGKGNDECSCQKEQIEAHEAFYQDLRNRFRYKKQVDDFCRRHFDNHVVLGMHIIRAAGDNGEHGDKVRGIVNVTDWVNDASQRIVEVTTKNKWKKSPLLYITTDMPSLIDLFRSKLKGIMPVIQSPLEHYNVASEDSGRTQDLQCIREWENKVMDMIVLSHVDMLIAGRMSSLEQTMPMSLVFAKQAVKTPKCELNHDATKLTCSKTYMDWCCHVSASKLRPMDAYQREEAIMVKHPDRELDLKRFKVKGRSKDNAPSFTTHLPYYWKTRAMFTTKNL